MCETYIRDDIIEEQLLLQEVSDIISNRIGFRQKSGGEDERTDGRPFPPQSSIGFSNKKYS